MKKSRKGYTLIELILTIALVGLVLQAVYSLFFAGSKSYSMGVNRGFAQKDVRLLGDYLNNEFKYVTDLSLTDDYAGEYYSIKIEEVEEKKFLVNTLHNYKGDGSESDKDSVTDRTVIRRFSGNWNRVEILNGVADEDGNLITGQIKIFIEQEEGNGTNNADYKLIVDIETVNKSNLEENIQVNLVEGGEVFYKNALPVLKPYGVDISSDVDDTNFYNINFYGNDSSFFRTISGYPGQSINMTEKPTRDGMYISEWNENPDGSGSSYSTSLDFIIQSYHQDLYAIWTEEDPILSDLRDLSILTVKDYNGVLADFTNGAYNVEASKDMTIELQFNYNKSTDNLAIIVTGFDSTFDEENFRATLTGTAPRNNITRFINIEIREKSNPNVSIHTFIYVKGISMDI